MGALMDVVGAALSVGSGGIFGAGMALVGAWLKGKQALSERAHQALEWAHTERMHALAISAGQAETENEIKVLQTEGAWRGLSESVRAEASIRSVHTWVNDIRALFRPMLTLLMLAMAAWTLREVVTGTTLVNAFTVDEQGDLVRYMVNTVFFTAGTVTLWWYGERNFAPPGTKAR
jgi:hypothetical protein